MRVPALHYGTCAPPNFLFRPVRTRLLARLESESVSQEKVVSIMAPVGYGKTVLMAQLYSKKRQEGQHCFWVGLGHRDVSVSRLATLMKAAMSAPRTERHAAQFLFSGDTPTERLVDELVEAVSNLPMPSTFFIDNLNSCTEQTLDELLDALIFRTPSSVRFVWSSTTVPPVSAGRAKLEGLLRQVSLSDLNFDLSEARELLGDVLTRRIGDTGTDAVLRRTEGWPAGIRMAQIALTDADHPAAVLATFSGSDEDVSAMLNRQVFGGFSPALRDFALTMALLNTFSVDLCGHLFGAEAARQHLELLLVRNVFIIPLDRNRSRYRFHGLFREYLLSETIRSFAPEKRRAILKRTAEWCEGNEEWEDAIAYALEAREFDLAGRILDRTANLFVRDRGDIQQYVHWMDKLMPSGARIGWEAHFWYIWALVFHRRFSDGLKQLALLAERVRRHKGSTDAPPDDLRHRIDYIRLCVELFRDHIDAAHAGAEKWLSTVTKCDIYNFGSVLCIKAICLASKFRFIEARNAMSRAASIYSEIGSAYAEGWVALINGIVSFHEGEYVVSHKLLANGLAKAREALGDNAVLCSMLAFADAKCATEMGLDAEALELFLSGLRNAHIHGVVDITSYGFEAAVKLWDGSANGKISIDALRQIAGKYPPRLSLMLSCFLIRRLLSLGRHDEALAESEKIGLVRGGSEAHAEHLTIPSCHDLFFATWIDVLIAQHQFKEAEARIAQELQLAQQAGRHARIAELWLDRMSIAAKTGNPSAAAKALSRAVNAVGKRRILRPFRDHAELIAEQVNDTKPSAWVFAREEEQKFFAEICASLPISNPMQHDLIGNWDQDSGQPISPTKKEAELLRLLDLGLSNQQIADYANVSIDTIKWHLKNLYRKLGVPSRSAALARARSMKLLRP